MINWIKNMFDSRVLREEIAELKEENQELLEKLRKSEENQLSDYNERRLNDYQKMLDDKKCDLPCGTVVRLKSGGPKMVVDIYGTHDSNQDGYGVWCTYIYSGTLTTGWFRFDSLEKIND